MTNFKDFLEEQLKDDEIRKEYEKLEQEMDEYKGKDSKELNSLHKKSYDKIFLLDGKFSPLFPSCKKEKFCDYCCTNMIMYDNGVVERYCPIYNVSVRDDSLDSVIEELRKVMDKEDVLCILEKIINIESEDK